MGQLNSDASEQLSLLTFDDEGDLRLEVGEGEAKRTFVVCSRALARASKPLRAMLYGPFAESESRKIDPNWTVQLPEDLPEAFATILRIVHGQFEAVPDEIDRDELYQITVLTDKYNMTDILQPWAQKWITNLDSQDRVSQEGDEVMLWISWELGHQDLFLETLNWLLNECSLDEESCYAVHMGCVSKTTSISHRWVFWVCSTPSLPLFT